MMNDDHAATPGPAKPRKSRWGFYLLMSFGVLIALFVIGLLLVWGYARSLVSKYISTSPRPLPKAQYDPALRKELERKWGEFAQAGLNHQTPGPLTITADDLNVLVAQDKKARESVRLVITNNQIQAEFSAPLDQTGRKELKGRYANGTAKINLVFQDGWLNVHVGNIEANGHPIPKWLEKRIGKENLVKNMDRNQDAVDVFQQLQSVRVEGENLVLRPATK